MKEKEVLALWRKHDDCKHVAILYRNSTGIYESMKSGSLLQWELKDICYTPPKYVTYFGGVEHTLPAGEDEK